MLSGLIKSVPQAIFHVGFDQCVCMTHGKSFPEIHNLCHTRQHSTIFEDKRADLNACNAPNTVLTMKIGTMSTNLTQKGQKDNQLECQPLRGCNIADSHNDTTVRAKKDTSRL